MLFCTLTGSLADTVMNTPVRDWVNLLLKLLQILRRWCKMRLLKCLKEGEEKGKRRLNPSKCCNRTPGSARRPQNRVMWSAEQHIVDSNTVNLGPPDMPGQNFAGLPDGATNIISWSAWQGVAKMVPALALNSDFAHQYLRYDHIREQNTFYKKVF